MCYLSKELYALYLGLRMSEIFSLSHVSVLSHKSLSVVIYINVCKNIHSLFPLSSHNPSDLFHHFGRPALYAGNKD